MSADFLLELLSEEIPARMQAKAEADLRTLFAAEIAKSGLSADAIETYSTPRRLALIARNLPRETAPVSEERKGPSASAPAQAIEGFLRSTGLTRDQLVEREDKKGVTLFALIEKPGRATADVLAEAIPAIVRAFPWPKSMRWGVASASTESPRWVRPLQGIVALLGEEIVPVEIAGIVSGAATVGHRFHHPGIITIGGAHDYAEKLRACHVIIDAHERRRIIADGARAAAAPAGLTLVEDDGLVAENAGLTEWPVPLLGAFDPAFLDVPAEVIQLTMRTNQKYFALTDGGGKLAPNFICTANIEASDDGAAIIAGNERVLSARLADAKFFWEQDLKVPLAEQAIKLDQIVFHEKLGTLADKVERLANLARWLVEDGIVGGSTPSAATISRHSRESGNPVSSSAREGSGIPAFARMTKEELADAAETAARLCKADLVTGMVGEFPELQGIIGGYLARAQGQPDAVADAIRDHYKPVGQGDDVPTAPVTVAVSLADKLDMIAAFFAIDERPTGSKDPFALRRSALGVLSLIQTNGLRLPLLSSLNEAVGWVLTLQIATQGKLEINPVLAVVRHRLGITDARVVPSFVAEDVLAATKAKLANYQTNQSAALDFFADRLKVQQREAGVRHDLIDAVFALGGEDDLVRLLARVKALQGFVEMSEGADLLAGYKRASNILKKEGYSSSPQGGEGRVRGSEASSERGESANNVERRTPSPNPLPQGRGL
ncbi:MAG: glycine--tRNA ligase subunit beta [Pseudomonadota bacterium]|nr:glycine--tRNA ligase subunit beta [Pseudomonadota bacterium]